MGRSKVTKRIAVLGAVAATVLLLASCPLDLRTYVELLKTRDTLIPIEEVFIASAGDRFDMSEFPSTRQEFTYSFLISKYEITNAQFAKFIEAGGYSTQSWWTSNGWAWVSGSMPAITKPTFWNDPVFNSAQQPVVGISWFEAVAYCNWRSLQEGLVPAYGLDGRLDRAAGGYRLPTEAEWEYAAAKGAPGEAERIFAYGDASDPARVVCRDNVPMPVAPAAAGSRPAGNTPQGLCDMSGNVYEWCSDNSNPPIDATDRYYYTGSVPAINNMVIRSGSWSELIGNARCAWSMTAFPDQRQNYIGFRTVRRQ